MPATPTLRRIALLFGLSALALVGAAALIAHRNYRGMHSMLEADPPSQLLASPQLAGVAGLIAVSFESADGLKLDAWYVPSTTGAAVVIAHGTNSDRSTMLAEIRVLADQGFGVLAFDWPGLGRSQGTVRWDGQARRALTAAIDWLSSRSEIDLHRIGGLGFSIGGYVMTQVAAEDPRLRALVLEAPPPDFQDYIDVHCRRWGPLSIAAGRWALRDSGLLDPAFAAVRLIGKIAPRPILILGGTLDTEVPRTLVVKLYDAAKEPKSLWIVDDAEHGNYSSVIPVEYARRLAGFFRTSLGSLPPTR